MKTLVLENNHTLLENENIAEKQIQENINEYYHDRHRIEERLQELDNEWDMERILEVKAAALTLTGIILGLTQNKKWLLMPVAISAILMNQGVKGWSLSTPFFRRLGFRTRAEIDKERFALKALRGDFDDMINVPNSVWNAVNK